MINVISFFFLWRVLLEGRSDEAVTELQSEPVGAQTARWNTHKSTEAKKSLSENALMIATSARSIL
jgi:hypothetical protein